MVVVLDGGNETVVLASDLGILLGQLLLLVKQESVYVETTIGGSGAILIRTCICTWSRCSDWVVILLTSIRLVLISITFNYPSVDFIFDSIASVITCAKT
jgi:hypothetical protein